MISFLTGELRNIYRENSSIELDVSGVGYEVVLPVFVLDSLLNSSLDVGQEITLEIYFHSTERSPKPLLVGFFNQLEKRFFLKIIQVEGIGPLKAVSALIFPVSVIAQAIENEDSTILNQMPGIGSRAAQKMIATLKGKLMEIIAEVGNSGPSSSQEYNVRDSALEILVGLGFRESEALNKINEVLKEKSEVSENVEDIIREVFKSNQEN
ncbi:MAG: Holliday junction DNA helicase RuvA [Dehalococcoidia bacterium]|nr:Holliday junction DNA helicase RuvA [Dehalococcoidia bacterium]MEC7921303.1 Holliday junction branch migration protein RuvA [Chloroflexota bacterium]MEC9451012.1 Holliday junction branch migration protein RuvA [Chloroflexota bacterium]MQG04388.1 Holliday junction DNA helicase RuvA [SAR202 cluster bacterium]|tara:strand:- start:579 stop:1208 length:630 start_codon:yes stop_codon:yes gene_type:complete